METTRNIDKSVKYLARTILKDGETKKSTYKCLLPEFYKSLFFKNDEEISEDNLEYIKHSTILYNDMKATHYKCEWEDVANHIVRLKIYSAGAFGATDVNNNHLVLDTVVCIV